MPLAIISVCADKQLQETLEQAAETLNVGSIYNFDHYISSDDVTQYNGGADVVPVAFVSIDHNKEHGFETADLLLKYPEPTSR